MKRVVLLLVSLAALLVVASCGGGSSVTGPNGNATVNVPSKLNNRAFITNQYSGNLQIVNTQKDITSYYTVTNNNTGVSTSGGSPASAVAIALGGSSTWAILSPDDLETLVYSPVAYTLTFVTNSSEKSNGSVTLGTWSDMALYSPDSKYIYVPLPAAAVTNSPPGVIVTVTTSTGNITGSVPVPGARYIALSPDGNALLAFATNSDSIYIYNPTATNPKPVALTGFSRPVNAFFSSDSKTAYIINCGPECGGTAGPPSVMRFDIASQTVTATVPVAGASVGLLSNSTLYVAGYPGGSTGSLDVVDISSMTRTTTNPIAIGDGTHTTMAISNNNKLYIGAVTCLNQTHGCLSIVDIGKAALDGIGQPFGGVTGLLAPAGRNVMYTVQGGILYIYDTSTGQLQSTQIAFRGALYGIVQVDH